MAPRLGRYTAGSGPSCLHPRRYTRHPKCSRSSVGCESRRLRPEGVRPRRYTCTLTSGPKGELFRLLTPSTDKTDRSPCGYLLSVLSVPHSKVLKYSRE